MTLAEILPSIHELTDQEKLRLIRILAEELEAGEDASLFEYPKVYELPTPYDSYGAARILLDALKADDESGA